MPALTTWIGVPLLGGVIGYVTDRIAVRMIFRPIRPRRILGFKVQGLIGRRQKELAKSIGRVVGGHLVQHEDIVAAFSGIDLEKLFGELLDSGLEPKIAELRSLPLIGGFLTEDRIQNLRAGILKKVMEHEDAVIRKLEHAIEQGLDVRAMVTEKVAAFRVETLESLVLEVAARELRAIEIFGAVLGVIIGVAQVFLIWGLS